MIIKLTGNERLQFQYVLPIQGDFKTLEIVENILEKCKIFTAEDLEVEKDIDFIEEEFDLILKMISFLDDQKQINFQSMPLIKKIMKFKEAINV